MSKPVYNVVKRPGRAPGDADIEIPVAEDLVTVPGVPKRDADVAFYSREYPLQSQNIEKTADRDWVWTVYTDEFTKYRKGHEGRVQPLIDQALLSGDLEPTGAPEPGVDPTEKIRGKAREMGFGEVGFTRLDRKYVFAAKKRWVKFEHSICLALEQDYEQTQTIPDMEAEYAHYGTYEIMGELALALADYIRALGYRAQIHSPNDNSAAYIPMFVEAGLGQLGANGQLLSPHFGSRARLMMITTDAPVIHDKPIDYGIQTFCQKCQVCVNRCPGRALVRDKVWWRGVEKNKLIYDRCRPVMARYDGCGVCIKVCPVQRYGMKPVMEHYVATGDVLGKGTDNLEGYTFMEKGYFGSGKLPQFDHDFFDLPHGTREDWLFERFKQRLTEDGVPSADELTKFAEGVKTVLDKGPSTRGDE